MGFGTGKADVTSINTTATCEAASKTDEDGVIVEETTYGAAIEVTEEVFVDAFVNAALNGQVGSSGTPVTMESGYAQTNDGYARGTTRTREPGPAAAA